MLNQFAHCSNSSSSLKDIPLGTIPYFLGFAIFASLISVVTIILNCIFIATMLSIKKMYKSISNRLMTVLSVVDLLQGMSVWPLAAAHYLTIYRLDINCLLLDFMYTLGFNLTWSTVWTILLIALEQYIAILHPYFYIAHVTFYRLLGPMAFLNFLFIIIDIVGRMKLGYFWIAYRTTLLSEINAST